MGVESETVLRLLEGVQPLPIDGPNVEIWETAYPVGQVIEAMAGPGVKVVLLDDAFDFLTGLGLVCRSKGGRVWGAGEGENSSAG